MKANKILTLFILAVVIFRLFYIKMGFLNLAGDEAHYWDWSRHLSLSYYSKPPMVAYIIALFTKIFGNNELGVRFGALFLSVLIIPLTFKISKELFKDEKLALFSSILTQIIPIYATGGILMTIDPPLVFFFSLSTYFFYKAINSFPWYWYLLGISIGLGLLSKYTMAFILISVILYLLFSKKDRFWLYRKEPYLMLFICLILFLPVIIWNSKNQWVTFKHLIYRGALNQPFSLSLKYLPEFLGSQLLVISPFIFIGFIYSLWVMGKDALKGKHPFLFLFLLTIPIFLFHLLLCLHCEIGPNWPVAGYYPLCLASPIIFKGLWRNKIWRLLIVISLGFSFFLTIFIHFPIFISKIDPTNRLRGWRELGKEVSKYIENKNFIVSDSYQITSELAFYVKDQPNVYCVNLGRRQNQYDYWPSFYSFKGMDAIYVRDEEGIQEGFTRCFERTKLEKRLDIYHNKNLIKSFYIYRCFGFKGLKPCKPYSY